MNMPRPSSPKRVSPKPVSLGQEPLCVIVESGQFRRVHYALALACAAGSIDRPTLLLFTSTACHALTGGREGKPGWHELQGEEKAGVPKTAVQIDADQIAKGLAGFEELLQFCQALNISMMVCEMGLKAETLSQESLRSDLTIEVSGLVTFLNRARPPAQILII